MALFMFAAALAAAAAVLAVTTAPLRRKKKAIASLQGKHVFVTGASSGIGLAIAKQALSEGAFVTLSARNELKVNKAADMLAQELQCDAASRIRISVANVGDHGAISCAVREAFAWRPIDVLVCNAGLSRAGYTDELPIELLEEQVQTNLMGVIYTVHAALPLMKPRQTEEKMSIVIISSAAALFLLYGSAVYTATKHALKGFAECLHLELLPYNINVNLICPGFVNTPFLENVDKEGEFDELLKKLNLYDRRKLPTPESIAGCALEAVKDGSFLVVPSKALFPILAVSRGLLAAASFRETLAEALWLPLIRLLSLKLTADMKKEILDHHLKKKKKMTNKLQLQQ